MQVDNLLTHPGGLTVGDVEGGVGLHHGGDGGGGVGHAEAVGQAPSGHGHRGKHLQGQDS